MQAAQNDPARFAEVYEATFERVYAFIARRVRDRDVAEDLTSAFDPQHGLLAVGATHVGYSDDIRKKTWLRYSDLNLNALSFDPTGAAVAVGAKGVVVRFSRPLAPSNLPETKMLPAN